MTPETPNAEPQNDPTAKMGKFFEASEGESKTPGEKIAEIGDPVIDSIKDDLKEAQANNDIEAAHKVLEKAADILQTKLANTGLANELDENFETTLDAIDFDNGSSASKLGLIVYKEDGKLLVKGGHIGPVRSNDSSPDSP